MKRKRNSKKAIRDTKRGAKGQVTEQIYGTDDAEVSARALSGGLFDEGLEREPAVGAFTELPAADALPDNFPAEDMALKDAMQFFAEELLPYLKITEKPVSVGPTEVVYLDARRFHQDFNFIVSPKSWIHLEFESDSVKTEDLRRFRSYEAVTSFIYHVDITTYVICSSAVSDILSEMNTGYNTYRVVIIRLKDNNADKLFQEIMEKQERGESLEKKDLVPLLLSVLMEGTLSTKERIILSNRLMTSSGTITGDELQKMQAVLYTFANKFLEEEELKAVKEALFMTRLGQMLVNDGIEIGLEKGLEKGAKGMITTFQEFGLSFDETLEKVMEKLEITRDEADKYMKEYWREKQ